MPRTRAPKPPARSAYGTRAPYKSTDKRNGKVWWRLRVDVPGEQKPRYLRGETPEEVCQKRIDLLVELQQAPRRSVANGATVGELCDEWIDVTYAAKGRSGASNNGRRAALNHIKDGLGTRPAGELTRQEVQAFINARSKPPFNHGKGLAKRSLRYVLETLILVLDDAEIVPNPAAKAVVPVKARPAVKRPALEAERIQQAIADLAGHRFEHLFVCYLLTGVRRNELLGLTEDGLDLTAKPPLLTVERGGNLRARDGGGWEAGDPKREKSVRTFDLDPLVVFHLKAQLRKQRELQMANRRRFLNSRRLVFTTATGRHHDPRNINRAWRKFADDHGLKDVVPHQARHSVASHMLDRGMTPQEVADYLGNTPATVIKTYSHPVRPVARSAGIMEAIANGR